MIPTASTTGEKIFVDHAGGTESLNRFSGICTVSLRNPPSPVPARQGF
jgi:hypothetical protein